MKNSELKIIMELPGIPGREEIISEYISKKLNKAHFEIHKYNLGSIFGFKPAKKGIKNPQTLMIEAHMDEVGFIVLDIMDNGLLQIVEKGYINKNSLLGKRLRVWTDDFSKSYSGTILIPKPKTLDPDKQKTPEIELMYLDIGATSKEEVGKMEIEIRSPITFDNKTSFTTRRVISKSADNRVGVAMMIELIDFIKNNTFDFNVMIGSASQEEVGLRGAKTSSYEINPDLAIVIDTSPAKDIPTDKGEGALGKGTYLRHSDRMYITLPKIKTFMKNILVKNKIVWQNYFSTGGTNSGYIHLSREGVPVIPAGILIRNIHTGSTVFDLDDYKETMKFLELLLKNISNEKIKQFKKS